MRLDQDKFRDHILKAQEEERQKLLLERQAKAQEQAQYLHELAQQEQGRRRQQAQIKQEDQKYAVQQQV